MWQISGFGGAGECEVPDSGSLNRALAGSVFSEA